MGRWRHATDSERDHEVGKLLTRRVAPGVYFASDGMLTADSLDSAIAYLSELADRGADGTREQPR